MQISRLLANSRLAPLDAELLLAYVLRRSREFLFTHPDFEVARAATRTFQKLVKKRSGGISVARLLGRKEFFGLEFEVNEHVLVPRPESEFLVAEVLKIQPKSLIDVGTGSGCLAIAIKKHLPNCEVWGGDVSREALKLARRNAKKHKVEVNLIESDLLTKIPLSPPLQKGEAKGFEVVIANLPYIPEDSKEVEKGVKKFEPACALFGGCDGLDLIRRLLTQISVRPKKPKFVLLEFGGGGQIKVLEKFARRLFPNAKIEFRKDLAGIPRVLKLQLK